MASRLNDSLLSDITDVAKIVSARSGATRSHGRDLAVNNHAKTRKIANQRVGDSNTVGGIISFKSFWKVSIQSIQVSCHIRVDNQNLHICGVFTQQILSPGDIRADVVRCIGGSSAAATFKPFIDNASPNKPVNCARTLAVMSVLIFLESCAATFPSVSSPTWYWDSMSAANATARNNGCVLCASGVLLSVVTT